MERSERMKKAYEYLRFQGLAGTQEDVADMLNHTDPALKVTELYIKRNFKIINVSNMEVLNFVLGQTEGRVRADLPTMQ